MIAFNHSGNIGDIIYSLYFCKELVEAAGKSEFNFHIQTNVEDPTMKNHSHPFGNVRMTDKAAEMLKPLLLAQPYINEVTISNDIPENSINLDIFRKLKINFASGNIAAWYYNLSKQHLPRKFEEKVLFVEGNTEFKDKIILASTERYQNVFINYKVLEPYKDKFIFIGTKQEHELFNKNCFNVEYKECNDFKEIASIIQGAKGFIGNQCGIYSFAEALKVPRILVPGEYFLYNNKVFPGPVNVQPAGGWNEVASTNEKLVHSIEEMLKI